LPLPAGFKVLGLRAALEGLAVSEPLEEILLNNALGPDVLSL
jgi:hypothetical protein